MRKITLKVAVAILAFTIGIIASVVWFIKPLSSNQPLEVAQPADIQNETTEEYAVYSVVINDLFVKERDYLELLIISDETSFNDNESHKAIYGDNYIIDNATEQRVRQMKENYPSVGEETLFDYEIKNARPTKLKPNLSLPLEYLFIDAKKLKEGEGYASKSMIRLSGIGFNKEKTEAFVYVEFFCPLCGQSNQLLLEKENGFWKIKEDFGGWVS